MLGRIKPTARMMSMSSKPVKTKRSYLPTVLFTALVALGPGYFLFKPTNKTKEIKNWENAKKEIVPESHVRRIEGVPFVKYVLVGGGTASHSALEAIREQEPDADVLIISEEQWVPYQRPPLSKELWWSRNGKNLEFNNWENKKMSVFYYPTTSFYVVKSLKDIETETTKVKFLPGTTVEKIDAEKQLLVLKGGRLQFGKVLIATGGRPRELDFMKNMSSEISSKVSTFRTIDDFKKLEAVSKEKKTIAIVGVSRKTCEVVQIFPEEGNIASVLPKYLTKWTTKKLNEDGVKTFANCEVKSIRESDSGVSLVLQDGKEINVDHVVVAAGLVPNTDLAKNSGLEVDESIGGIVVNAELEARSNIFAAGDVTSYHDIALGRRRVEHYDHAATSGRAAGLNMTGAKLPYNHQSMFWSNVGRDVNFEAVGIINSALPTVSIWNKTRGSPSVGDENFDNGVVYYLRNKRVVGVLLWNVPGKLDVARALIAKRKFIDDPSVLSTAIDVHVK